MSLVTTQITEPYVTHHKKVGPDGAVWWQWADTQRNQRVYLDAKDHGIFSPVYLTHGIPFRDMKGYRHGSIVYNETFGNYKFSTSDGGFRVFEGAYPWETLEYIPSEHVGNSYFPGPKWDSNRQNRSQVECMLKLQDCDINIGVALGESRETLGMIAKTLSRLIRAYRAARRGNFLETARQLKLQFKRSKGTPFDQWMELQYGWLPMMADIHGATKKLQKGFKDKSQILSATRVLTDVVVRAEETVGNGIVIGHSERKHRCKIYAKVEHERLFAASQLGIINPVTIAWELVPFSFVVDWFLPIGNVIEATTATMGLEFITGATSCKVQATHQKVGGYIGPQFPSSGERSGIKAMGTTTVRSYERVALGSFPLPRPYYKNPFSSNHTVTALALLRQLTGRH